MWISGLIQLYQKVEYHENTCILLFTVMTACMNFEKEDIRKNNCVGVSLTISTSLIIILFLYYLMNQFITLYNGYKMPILGLGYIVIY